jgi:hypothetical protein
LTVETTPVSERVTFVAQLFDHLLLRFHAGGLPGLLNAMLVCWTSAGVFYSNFRPVGDLQNASGRAAPGGALRLPEVLLPRISRTPKSVGAVA